MDLVDSKRSTIETLRNALNVLTRIDDELASIGKIISTIEKRLSIEEIKKSGLLHRGLTSCIVCPIYADDSDALHHSLANTEFKKTSPSIVRIRDTSEAYDTCKKAAHYIRSLTSKTREISLIGVLKSSRFIAPLDNDRTVVLGSRYIHASIQAKDMIQKNLAEQQIDTYWDCELYGGGPLVYYLLEHFSNHEKATILQATVSERLAQNPENLSKVIHSLCGRST